MRPLTVVFHFLVTRIVDVEMRVATPMDTSPDEYADEPLSPLVVEEAVIDAVAKWDGEGWDIMSSSGQAFEVDKVAEQRAGHIVLKEKANDLGAYVSIVDVIPIRESPKILEGGALVRHGKADGHLWTFAHLPAGPR